MTKIPKYIPDTPHGEDFFNIHTQIAEMLKNTILAEDVSKNSFTLGLLGSWGSGKSMTIGKLRDKISSNSNIIFIEFDVWKYVDTSLYRSILIDLEKDLKTKSVAGLINESYKTGIRTSEGKNLHEVLYKSTQVATPKLTIPEDYISKLILDWNKSKIGKIGSFLLLSPLSVIINITKYILSRSNLFYFLLLVGILFSSIYYYRSNIESVFPILKDQFLKPIFKYLAFSVLGLSGLELIKETFKDLFKEMLPKTNNNIIITSPPTFAQDQFEVIFQQVIENISRQGKKIVIVFDNIDRCESNVTIQILTGLKTFLDHKNCFYLIPCDDMRIKKHLRKSNGAEDDYLDKIFQAYIRIPQIEGDDKNTFIEKCIELADFELLKSDELKISQILTLAYKAETPRQIKRFFNDFISYYRLAEVIDPKKEILLKDIALFTFMIAIKQKWNEIEELILENPNFFEELDTYANKPEVVAKDCYQFIDICKSWIDHTIDPANFIYLKNSKNSSNQVQRIFINGFNEFKITAPLIQQIEKYLNSLISSNKLILFESGLDRLKEIIELKKDEIDSHLVPEIFKVYFKILLRQHLMNDGKEKPSFLSSHSKFIADHIIHITNLDRNSIPMVEKQICEFIRKSAPAENTTYLYNSLKSQFQNSNLKLIFNLVTYDEFVRLYQLALQTDKDKLLNIFEPTIIEKIAGAISFQKDESLFMDFLDYLKDNEKINPVKKTISSKINVALSQIQGSAEHEWDNFIIRGLTSLKNEDWDDNEKVNLNLYLNDRLYQLFRHQQNVSAIDYCIEGIKYKSTSVNAFFDINNNNNLDSPEIFEMFISKIAPSTLTLAMEDDLLCKNILRICCQYSQQASVLPKISAEFLNAKIDSFIYKDLNWLIEFLKQCSYKKVDGVNESLIVNLEKNIIEKYISTYPELIYQNHEVILPHIKNEINKNYFIEKSVDHFKSNPTNNVVQISHLLNSIEADSEIIKKIYSNSKMQLLEIDDIIIFQTLLLKLNSKDKEDYLERIFTKISANIKVPGNSNVILKSLSNILPISEFQKKQRIVIDLIKELFEPSREETDIQIGIDLAQKLKGENNRRDLGLSEQIDKLIEMENKSLEIKIKLQSLK